MNLEIIETYTSRLKFFRGLAMVLLVIQLLVSIYYLFLPNLVSGLFLDQSELLVIGVIVSVVGLLLSARIVDLEGDKSEKLFRVITLAGLIHQHFIGVNTLFPITFYILAVIGQHLLITNMYTIQRTQDFASHEKITEEVYLAISHANHYLQGQIKWLTEAMIFLTGVAVVSILLISFFTLVPLLVPNVVVLQYMAIISLLLLLILVIIEVVPIINTPEEDLDFVN